MVIIDSNLDIGENLTPGGGYNGENAGVTITGTTLPVSILEIHNKYAVGIDLYSHDDAEFRAPYISLFKTRGTQVAPTSVKFTGYELDSIGGINFGGWDGEKYFAGSAAIYSQTDEDWTPTSHGGHISIYGTNSGNHSTQQIAQFGGRDANGFGSNNIVFYRPLTWGGNKLENPAIYPQSGTGPNPVAVLKFRSGDGTADASITTGSIAASGVVSAGQFAVAGLPVGVEGQTAYATNGRKLGETGGAGTGVPVYFSNGNWRVYSTDAPVAF